MLVSQIQINPKIGLSKTIELMNLLENKSLENQKFIDFVFSKFHSNCAACIPGKIWRYMQENFQYVADEPFDELLIAPYLMPSIKKGDCDDFSLFAKTCIDLLGGFYSNYILFGKEKNKFYNVVLGGQGVHIGMSALYDCKRLKLATFGKSITMNGEKYGSMEFVISKALAGDDEFFQPFIEALKDPSKITKVVAEKEDENEVWDGDE